MQTTIKIPKGLALAVAHSKSLRKSLETYFLLKARFEHGYFDCSRAALQDLQSYLCISHTTAEKRLKHLKKIGLLTFNKKTALMSKHSKLYTLFECKGANYRFKYEIHQVVRLENLLEQLAISEKKQESTNAYKYKISQGNLKQEIQERVDRFDLHSSFTEQVNTAHCLDFLEGADTENTWLFYNRADSNIGYKRFSQIFGYNSWGGFAYKKRKLAALGLISVEKRSISFDSATHKTTAKRTTDLGTVVYDRRTSMLTLTLPDAITIFSQSQILKNAA